MIKKILLITAKIVVGIFIFYLFLGFVVAPFALTWAIKDQGQKFLNHPVNVRSVQFNPLLLRLDVYGLAVLDTDKQPMLGFDRLSVDVSFLGLLKKTYRIESVKLDGLLVNAMLTQGGHVNLLNLVPKTTEQGGATAPTAMVSSGKKENPALLVKTKMPAVQPAAAQPLPVVIVDDIALRKGKVHFTDLTVNPHFTTIMSDIDIYVTGLTTRPDCLTRVTFQARLDEKGVISNELLIKPFVQPLELETTFTLNGYAMNILSPYVGKYTGRSLKDGNLELRMDYRIANNRLTASHKVLVQRFEFGQKVASKDALSLPFGLAVALLEDPQGRINISLPVTGDMSKPNFRYWPLVGQVVRNFFTGLVTKPFTFLASALGAQSGTDELGYVRFEPGQKVVPDAEKEKLKTLVKGLKDRPKLALEVNGTYDKDADWKAIKTEVLTTDFKVLRSQSTRTDSWVYQMLYQRRFGLDALWALTKKYKSRTGVYDDAKLVEEAKRRLIEDGAADKVALAALAVERAKVVHDLLVEEGLEANRVSVGPSHEAQASMGFVPLDFTLTVYGDKTVAVSTTASTAEKPVIN